MVEYDPITDSDALEPRHVFNLSRDEFAGLLVGWGEPAYRAEQVLDWVYRKRVVDFAEMTNLGKSLRGRLEGAVSILEGETAGEQCSSDGTVKMLLRWRDGATSECVVIPDGQRCTACISSQVGCPVGCVFCASGLGGLQRQLTAGQIVEQVFRAAAPAVDDGGLTNVVFMGLGEPLANYDATIKAIRTINAAWGVGLGARRITVSTVGLPTQMRRLADEAIQITLALSLHAPGDALRRELIPWAERVSVDELVDACRYYFDRTGREVTLEYILLGGVNDTPVQARDLVRVAKRMRCNVNLIAYNPVTGLPYGRPSDEAVHDFHGVLRQAGVNTHLRRSRGLDIDAACGQLRRREREQPVTINRPS